MSDGEDFDEQIRLEAEERVRRSAAADLANAGQTKVDPDGTVYEWDLEKHAWFPKIDQDFIAQYLMNYGADSSSSSNNAAGESSNVAVSAPEPTDPSYAAWYYKSCYGVDPDVSDPAYKQWYNYYYGGDAANIEQANFVADTGKTSEEGVGVAGQAQNPEGGNANDGNKAKDKDSKALKRKELSWFELDEQHNSNVYISGLPTDITQAEFEEMMTKCGLIAYDPDKRKPKLKLYKDQAGKPKGDGLCSYIKKESVELAMQIIDGWELRGSTISVEPARFQMKGDFDPSLRKKPKSNKLKRKLKEKQEKLLDWHPDALPGQRKKSDKVVILKNMFEPQEFDNNPVAIQEIKEDIRVECSKYGQAKKVTVFDRNSEGVILVLFKEPEEADACIAALNGRWFAGRKAHAEVWDGKSKYEVEETEQEREQRIKKWESFLEKGAEEESGVANLLKAGDGTATSALQEDAPPGSVSELPVRGDAAASDGATMEPVAGLPAAAPAEPGVLSDEPKTVAADCDSTDDDTDAANAMSDSD